MPHSYRVRDSLTKLGVAAPFGVNETGVHVFECLRLLCGTCDLVDKISGKEFKLRHCFLSGAQRKLHRGTLSELIKIVFDNALQTEDVRGYLEKVRPQNVRFWDRLKGELCLSLACLSQSNSTLAFLHIYRLYEMFSVALPLFYASAEHDYYKSMDFIKALNKNTRDGDLAVLREFSKIVESVGNYQGLTMTIFYSKGDPVWDRRFGKQIEDFVIRPEKLKVTLDAATTSIDVPFSEFPSFFVTFRNRLFHNAQSQSNFDLDALHGADMACEPLLKPALNWFTLTLCAVVNQNASRHI